LYLVYNNKFGMRQYVGQAGCVTLTVVTSLLLIPADTVLARTVSPFARAHR
jgi:hypothetical protein